MRALVHALALFSGACDLAPQFTPVDVDAGVLALEPLPLDFGSVSVPESRTLAVSLGNHSEQDITLTGLRVSGQGFGLIEAVGLPTLLQPEPVGFELRYQPTAPRSDEGALHVAFKPAGFAEREVAFPVVGVGLMPQIEVSPTELAFGLDADQRLQAFTIRNTGNQPLPVLRLEATAEPPGAFRLEPEAITDPIGPGDAQVVLVVLTPDSGAATGAVHIEHGDPLRSEVVVALKTTEPAPDARPEESMIFVELTRAISEERLSARLWNGGETALEIRSIALTGTACTLIAPPACPCNLAPGNATAGPFFTLEILASLTGDAPTVASCALRIETNDPDGPTEIAIEVQYTP